MMIDFWCGGEEERCLEKKQASGTTEKTWAHHCAVQPPFFMCTSDLQKRKKKHVNIETLVGD